MSKLANSLFTVPTNKLCPSYELCPVTINEQWTEDTITGSYRRIYNLCAQFSVSIAVLEGDTSGIDEAIKRGKREILEGVFGEFRTDLYKLSRLISSQQLREAQMLIEQIISNMYNPGAHS
jgi:hypothetical protein